jgi:hypothetical protein
MQIAAIHAGTEVACPACRARIVVPMETVRTPAAQLKAARPTCVTVLGILCILFGGVSLTCANFQFPVMPIKPGQPVVTHRGWDIAAEVVSRGGGLLQVVVGIGLLNLKRWARAGAIACGILQIILMAAGAVWFVGYALPAMRSLVPDAEGPDPMGAIALGLAAGIVVCLNLIWPAVLIAFMRSQKVREACVVK